MDERAMITYNALNVGLEVAGIDETGAAFLFNELNIGNVVSDDSYLSKIKLYQDVEIEARPVGSQEDSAPTMN